MGNRARLLRLIAVVTVASSSSVEAFAAAGGGAGKQNKGDSYTPFPLFDRFRPTCPASLDCIRQYEPSLVPSSTTEQQTDDDVVWVAVHRSFNNKPSVIVKDNFLKAMRSATTDAMITSSNPSGDDAISGGKIAVSKTEVPVAVARLRKKVGSNNNDDDDDEWILDSMRCILKKETTDASCDGGSEHTEALSTAIDTLLQHYLLLQQKQQQSKSSTKAAGSCFEGVIRTKATLVSSALLEDRGFRPVDTLQKDDMTITHTSSLDDCLERYAARSVSTNICPGARQRAIDIVSKLGRVDRQADFARAQQKIDQQEQSSSSNGDDDNDEFDPWSGVKRFI